MDVKIASRLPQHVLRCSPHPSIKWLEGILSSSHPSLLMSGSLQQTVRASRHQHPPDNGCALPGGGSKSSGDESRRRHSSSAVLMCASQTPDAAPLQGNAPPMKKNRLQHVLTDAQRLRSADSDSRDVVGRNSAELDQLAQIYDRVRQRNFSAGGPPHSARDDTTDNNSTSSHTPPSLSAEDLVLARAATHFIIAKMDAVTLDEPVLARLLVALKKELPRSFANTPHKRLEPDARCWYAVGKCIGKGTFGRVYAGNHRMSGTKVAIKSYFREQGALICCAAPPCQRSTQKAKPLGDADALEWKRVRQEVKMMAELQPHPSIIRFIEAFETPTQMHVVMEFASGDSLCDVLRKHPHQRLGEPRARCIFHHLCAAVASLHAQNVIHRDLKLENVLLDKHDRPKVIDFGFSQFDYTCTAAAGRSNRSNDGPTNAKDTKNFCGTPSYMAPEVVSCKSYDGKKVDVWSLGVILFLLLCGKFPFQGQSFHQLYQNIRNLQFAIPAGLSKDAHSLLRAILVVDPMKRPSVRDLQTHPWMVQTAAVAVKGDEAREMHERHAARHTDRSSFFAFLQWEEAKSLLCEALVRLYGLNGMEVVAALRDKRHNGITAFIHLAILASEKKFVLLSDARGDPLEPAASISSPEQPAASRTNNNDSTRSSNSEAESTAAAAATHKQHLEKLIGLVKASLIT